MPLVQAHSKQCAQHVGFLFCQSFVLLKSYHGVANFASSVATFLQPNNIGTFSDVASGEERGGVMGMGVGVWGGEGGENRGEMETCKIVQNEN